MARVGTAEQREIKATVLEPLRCMHPPGSDRDEVEWQFETPDLERVRSWLAEQEHAPGLVLGSERTTALDDCYYDTADWRFHRAGYALRVRRCGGRAEVTLKSLSAATDGLHRRRELSAPLGHVRSLARTPAPVGERIRAVMGRHRLRRLFELHTERRIVPLTLGGMPAGEVALDATTIPRSAGQRACALTRVEVEVEPKALGAVAPFVGSLRTALALAPASLSKFEAGLAARLLSPPPPPDFGSTVVDDTMTAGEVAFAALRRHLAALRANEPGTRLGDDPEALHRARVAIRRLRAALRTFRGLLPPRARQLRGELGLIGATLGAVRDLDVHILDLDRRRAAARAAERAALAGLIAVLARRRALARRRMLRVLDSARYARLVAALVALVRRGPRRTGLAAAPVLSVAPDMIVRSYRKVRRRGDAIDTDTPAPECHALRIRCKHLRYAIEFHADVYGKPARALLRRLAALQDLLGAHQDAQVAAALLRDLAARSGPSLPARARAVAERVAVTYDRRAAALRTRIPKTYTKIRGRRWRRLRDLMEKRRAVGV
jgi:CHAD domain-containing protein